MRLKSGGTDPGDTSKIEQPEQVQSRELANEALCIFYIRESWPWFTQKSLPNY